MTIQIDLDYTGDRVTAAKRLVTDLPHMCDYTPENAIVVLGLKTQPNGNHRVLLTGVFHLGGEPVTGREPEISAPFARAGVDSAIAVFAVPYGTIPTPNEVEVARAFVTNLEQAGIHVLDTVMTDNDTVMLADGQLGRIAPADREAAAARFTVGQPRPVNVGSRDDLVKEVAYRGDIRTSAAAAAYIADLAESFKAEPDIDAHTHLIAGLLPTPGDQEQSYVIAAALTDVRVRDTVIHDLTRLDDDGLDTAAAGLTAMVGDIPGPSAGNFAATLAVARYLQGDGARANIAVERAVDADPGHSLATLVGRSMSAGLSPTQVREMFASLPREACLGTRAPSPSGPAPAGQGAQAVAHPAPEAHTDSQRARRGHDFYPAADSIPVLYATEDTRGAEKIIHAHYFHGGNDWFIAEYDPHTGRAFGHTTLAADTWRAEWGYIDLIDMEAMVDRNGGIIERDLDWEPIPFSEAIEQRNQRAGVTSHRHQSPRVSAASRAIDHSGNAAGEMEIA